MTEDLIGQYRIQPGRPLQLAPTPGDTASDLFEDVASAVLTDNGVLLRSSDRAVDDQPRRIFAYHFDRFQLDLTDAHHASFLGRVLLRREWSVAMTVRLTDPSDDNRELWSQSVDTTIADIIPKRDLPALAEPNQPYYSPKAPSTTLERLTIPLIGGALIGVTGLALLAF